MSRVLGPFTIRRAMSVALLTASWCALWGSVSFANVGSGLAVGFIASSRLIGTEGMGRVQFGPLVALAWLVAKDLAVSTVSVAREVLTPTDYTEEGIIAVDVPVSTRSHMLLVIVAVTVTPGTAVVDVDPDESRLYLHLLHCSREQATAEHVRELADLACRALPMPDDRSDEQEAAR